MARIAAVAGTRGAILRTLARASRPIMRRMAGVDTDEVMEPFALAGHSPWVLQAQSTFEIGLTRLKALDPRLRELARIRTATVHGCPW